jgi:hypothetical protein
VSGFPPLFEHLYQTGRVREFEREFNSTDRETGRGGNRGVNVLHEKIPLMRARCDEVWDASEGPDERRLVRQRRRRLMSVG